MPVIDMPYTGGLPPLWSEGGVYPGLNTYEETECDRNMTHTSQAVA